MGKFILGKIWQIALIILEVLIVNWLKKILQENKEENL